MERHWSGPRAHTCIGFILELDHMPSRRVFITEPSFGGLQAVCAPSPYGGTEKQDVTVHAGGRASLAPMVLGAS